MTDATMLEKAARAARDVVEGERSATTYKDIARAVLMAVREPDDKVVIAGICERHQTNVPEAWSMATSNIYKAMIDAILTDGAKR